MECPSCRAGGQAGLVCDGCGAILPARRIDAFAALGVPPRFAITVDEVETRARDLSRKLHPDRFGKAAPEVRMAAVQATTTLNDAARTLRDPMKRAQALLARAGLAVKDDERAPADLLADVLELREALEDAKDAGDGPALKQLADLVRGREAAAWSAVGQAFVRAEGGEAAALDEARQGLIELRYWQRFLDEHAGKEAH